MAKKTKSLTKAYALGFRNYLILGAKLFGAVVAWRLANMAFDALFDVKKGSTHG